MTTRQPPLWLRGEVSTNFHDDPRKMCRGKRDQFFDESIEGLAACQALCVVCPLFRDCTRWTLSQPVRDLEFGIFAGLTPHVRAQIASGKVEYYDWRQDWHRYHYTKKLAAAKSRQIYKTGRGKAVRTRLSMPPCAYCDDPAGVVRYGRARETSQQRYRCRSCRKTFLGERL